MTDMLDYLDDTMIPWHIHSNADSVVEALLLIEEKFGVIFTKIEFDYIEEPEDEEENDDPGIIFEGEDGITYDIIDCEDDDPEEDE